MVVVLVFAIVVVVLLLVLVLVVVAIICGTIMVAVVLSFLGLDFSEVFLQPRMELASCKLFPCLRLQTCDRAMDQDQMFTNIWDTLGS